MTTSQLVKLNSMKSILKRLDKLEEEISKNILESSDSTIQIEPKYKYCEVIVHERYYYESNTITYILFGLPIKTPGEFTKVYQRDFEQIPGEEYKTEKEANARVKKMYSSGIVIPIKEFQRLESELYILRNSDKFSFKPSGLKTGKFLFTDYSINEINELIKQHPIYKKLRRLGVILRANKTEFSGYTYNNNTLHLEFETKNGSTVFTNEASIDSFRNYDQNMIFYSARVVLPNTAISTKKDLDNTLKVMLDSYLNRDEIEPEDDN